MKRIVLALAILFSVGRMAAQYHVIHVEGRILTERQKMYVVEGMMLPDESSVTFQSEGAELSLWHPQKGRMYVKAEKADENPKALKSVLKQGTAGKTYPAKSTLSSKDDFEEYFKRGDYLLLGKTELVVSKEEFPMGQGRNFFVTYHWRAMDANGNSKLAHHGDTLVLDTAQILNMNGQKVLAKDLSEFKLLYFSNVKQYKTLCSFNLVMPDFNNLNAEVKALVKLLNTIQDGEMNLKEEVFGYVCDTYGYPDRAAFDAWYDANF